MSKSDTTNSSPNWQKLNEKFNERREAMNRFYDGLVARRNKTFNSEESLNEFIAKKVRFQEYANQYFQEWLHVIASLAGQEDLIEIGGYPGDGKDIFKNITVGYSKWKGLPPDPEFKNQATISLRSPLTFGAFGFVIILTFRVETNPETYAQEFRLTAIGGNQNELSSEREKQTFVLHSLLLEADWGNLGYIDEITNVSDRWARIEKEIYQVIDHFIYGGGMKTYRNVDFLMSTKLPK